MKGCPRCGAERLRSAPLPIIDHVRNLRSSRRRYRCSVCGWRGLRHRLVRSHDAKVPLWRRVLVSALVVLIVGTALVGGGLAYESCRQRLAEAAENQGAPE